jgi:hypothetical protein
MAKTLLNFIFYLCISIFAFQCGGSEAPKVSTSKAVEITESQEYVQDLITKKNVENATPKLKFDKENILITDMQNELHAVKLEVQTLRSLLKGVQKDLEKQIDISSTEIWSSPFSIYNQELLLDNGTTLYGNIIYQDTDIITLETMIGKINVQRPTVLRIISHHPDMPEKEEFLEAFEPVLESGNELYKKPAEVILYGNMFSTMDADGNQKLNGNVKNIGGKRADFVKLNITLYRDWSASLEPKIFTVFVEGHLQYLNPADSSLISQNSLDPKAIATFELIVPKSFGTVMSWTYEIDYEEYEK